MNMPDNTYTRLQEETQAKKIIAFGSGKFFREFMLKYSFLQGKIIPISIAPWMWIIEKTGSLE